MKEYRVSLPLDEESVQRLSAGDAVLLSGCLYTARDAAHKRLYECIQRGEELPIRLENETIYYVGPAPAKEGYAVGPAGPTSSYRMDKYTPALLERGLRAMLGKGVRSPEVKESMKKNKAVYFACIGGAAVLISKSIKKSELVCYEDLGPEAIYRFWIEDFPAIVAVDSRGRDQYEIGRKEFLEKKCKGEMV
ncbi:MAG: Fe-S-containing hydro-lyase [Johnsonella sp.]|nr:Fe-S-containing hydro-lyase [Johnsonella sp.]